MTTLESLKSLAVASGCGECTSDNIADAIQFIADHYTPPVTTNLFNINGEVDVNYAGVKQNLNTVSDGVLTCNANSSINHAVGQLIDTVVGKTYMFSAKCLNFGSGAGAVMCFYKSGTSEGETDESVIVGDNSFTYTATTDKTLFSFDTNGGTGAQFTDIKVREVSE